MPWLCLSHLLIFTCHYRQLCRCYPSSLESRLILSIGNGSEERGPQSYTRRFSLQPALLLFSVARMRADVFGQSENVKAHSPLTHTTRFRAPWWHPTYLALSHPFPSLTFITGHRWCQAQSVQRAHSYAKSRTVRPRHVR